METLKLRTATFGGFQRQDVVDYIESTAREHAAQLNALRAELKQAQEKADALEGEKARADALSQRCEDLTARVDELARGIAGGLEPLLAQGIAPVVLVEADQAKVLGQAMAQRVEGPLLCLDSVGVDNGDYIDIGAPVAGGAVLPVVIKTLVFNKS